MKHARQTIRESVATMLAGLSGVTITRSRVYPITSTPHIAIYINREASDLENDSMPSPRRYTRRAILQIDVAVEATTNHDDLADDYAAQIEALLGADLTLGSTCTDSKIIATDLDMSGDGNKPIAVTRLSYEVWYRTTETDAENAL